jgi:ribosomal protein S18 acetylase RimI-like enzyme
VVRRDCRAHGQSALVGLFYPKVSAAVQIREGEDPDAGWILDLGEELFHHLGDYREILGHWLELPRTKVLVAESDAERIGFTLLSPGRSIGFLWRPWAELVGIGVEQEHRGRGVGQQLLVAAIDVATEWRASEVRLHTAAGNQIGQSFFHRHGFRTVADDASVYPSGETAVSMARSLV